MSKKNLPTQKFEATWRFTDINEALRWLEENPKTGRLTVHIAQGTSGHAEFSFLIKFPLDKLDESCYNSQDSRVHH